MPTGDIGSVLDTLQFEAGLSNRASIAFGSGDLAVIGASGPDGDGWIYTCLIDSLGAISDTIEDSWEFDTTTGDYPLIVHVYGSIFACLYTDPSGKIQAFTFSVSSLGVITKSKIDTEFIRKPDDSADELGNPYSFFKKSAGNFAYAIMRTGVPPSSIGVLGINNSGTAISGMIPTLTLAYITHRPHQILASSGVGVVVGLNTAGHVIIETHSFSSLIGSYSIVPAAGNNSPKIAKVHSNVYVVICTGEGSDGYMYTCYISTAGAITENVESTFEFSTYDALYPDLLHIGEGVVAVLYQDKESDGLIATYPISDLGIIGLLIDKLEFDLTYAYWPRIARRGGDIYAIVYRGTGEVITLGISTPVLARPHHELLMGIGP